MENKRLFIPDIKKTTHEHIYINVEFDFMGVKSQTSIAALSAETHESLRQGYDELVALSEELDSDPVDMSDYLAYELGNTFNKKNNLRKVAGAKNIKHARKLLGLTQRKVWSTLGIPSRTYESWEMGEKHPSAWVEKMVIEKMCEI